jgi:hypothetical protein
MRNVSDRSCSENPNTHFVFSNFFFSRIMLFMSMWTMFQRGEVQVHRWQYGSCPLHAGYLRVQIPIQTLVVYTHCFPTATVVVRPHLNVMLYIHYLSCFDLLSKCYDDTTSHLINTDMAMNNRSNELNDGNMDYLWVWKCLCMWL